MLVAVHTDVMRSALTILVDAEGVTKTYSTNSLKCNIFSACKKTAPGLMLKRLMGQTPLYAGRPEDVTEACALARYIYYEDWT